MICIWMLRRKITWKDAAGMEGRFFFQVDKSLIPLLESVPPGEKTAAKSLNSRCSSF